MNNNYLKLGILVGVFSLIAASPIKAQTNWEFQEDFNTYEDHYDVLNEYNNFDFQVHTQNPDTLFEFADPYRGQHGMDCAAPGPGSVRDINNPEESIYFCKKHFMSSIDHFGGYGSAIITPNQLVDFRDKETKIRFNSSLIRVSRNSWFDIRIIPVNDNIAVPAEHWVIDLQGEPKNQIHISEENSQNYTHFQYTQWKDGKRIESETSSEGLEEWVGMIDDPKPRATFELTISKNRVKYCLVQYKDTEYNKCFFDRDISELGWETAMVRFGHHSYDIGLNNVSFANHITENTGLEVGEADTIHWDDFKIENSIPMTIIHTDKRVSSKTDTKIMFDSPAPRKAKLIFSALGDVGVSTKDININKLDPKESSDGGFMGVFKNYEVEIPEGTQEVTFKLGDGDYVKDARIFALGNENCAVRFSDVDCTDTFSNYITRLSDSDKISGFSDETYRAGNDITRGEFASMLVNGLELKGTTSGTEQFLDVSSDSLHAKNILLLKKLGIINGYSDGTFNPDKQISRGEMTKIIALTLEYIGIEIPSDRIGDFTDVGMNNPFMSYIYFLSTEKISHENDSTILSGSGNMFMPDDNLTRGQTAKVILNALERVESM